MEQIEQRAEELYKGNTIEMDAYIWGRYEQRAADHSEEHLAWITQEFLKWRESNNPKVSFGGWINASME